MKIFSKVLKKFFERRKLGKVSIFNDFYFSLGVLFGQIRCNFILEICLEQDY